MARGVRIIDRDRGARALFKRTGKRGSVTVGIHSGEGGASHEDAGGLTVLDVASIHEFGLNGVERSFIRRWADADREKHEAAERKLAEAVVRGKLTVAAAHEQLGLLLAAEAQKFIADGRATPALADATVARKGSSTPLIDKGQLRSSITHEVE